MAVPVAAIASAISSLVGAGTMIHNVEKQTQWHDQMVNAQSMQASLQQELSVEQYQASQELQLIKDEIAYREAAIQSSKIITIGAGIVTAISLMVFIIQVKKLNK